MAIRFRHDAAGVVPPSNASTRKYGQSLVLQQNQQKYQGQQAGYDRLFDAYKQQNQNAFQWNRDADQRVFQANQQQAQNNFQLGRDQAQQDLIARDQRKKDFDAARSRIDTYARDLLANGGITDLETRNKIQNLIAGKTIVMGSGFNETAQQEYLDKYNAELAKVLSDVPQKPTQDESLKSFLGEERYATYGHLPWVPNGKNGFVVDKDALGQQQKEQLQQQQELENLRPKTMEDYYKNPENKGQFKKDLDATMSALEVTDPTTGKVTTATREQALERMRKDYEFEQKALGRPQYGEPTQAPATPGAPPAVPGAEQSILETGQALPPAGIPITPPDSGQPPSPVQQKQPMPLVANSTSQNPWAEMAGAEQQPVATAPVPSAAPQGEVGGLPSVAPQPSNKAPAAPNFKSLTDGAANDTERAVVSQIETLYKGQSPDVQAAINVALDPNALDTDIGRALIYLREKGIDVNALAADAEKSNKPGEKAKGRMRDKYGSSYDSF